MANGTKVRLVRCPKCENLLPELPNLPVYQCGGCGAVLQAKNKPVSADGSSVKSDEERVLVSSEKMERKGEEGVSVSDSSEVSDRESNGIKERRAGSSSSSSSRNENKVVTDNNVDFRYDNRGLDKEMGIGGKYSRRSRSKEPLDNWVVGKDRETNLNQEKSVRVDMEREVGELEPQIGITKRSRQFPYWRPEERDGSTAYRRTPRAVSEGVRFTNSGYPEEGPSNYHPGSSQGLGERLLRNDNSSVGADRVDHLEQDRAELLRKLDELKNQLSRSDISDKVKERASLVGRTVSLDSYGGNDTRFSDGPSRANGPSVQSFAGDRHVQRPIYSNHGIEPVPMMNRRGMDMQNFYPPPLHASNEFTGYGDPFGPPLLGSSRLPHQYPQQLPNDYLPEQYMDIGPDHIASYPHNTFFHQPACSCLRCYHNRLQLSAQLQPGVFNNRRFVDAPTNPMLYHLDNHAPFPQRGYNPIDANYPLVHSREPQPLLRRQRDLDTETSAFGQNHPRRVPLAKRSVRHCFPIAGGAPFITCHNCFEVLPLRRNLLLKEKNQRKLQCGACTTVISFLVEGKSIIISFPVHNKEISSAAKDDSAEVVREDTPNYNGHENRSGTSDDYDNSGFNFQSTDTDPLSSLNDQRLNLRETENTQGLVSSRSTSSDDEESPDSVIVRKEASNFAEQPLGASTTPPLPGSPLHKRLDNLSSDQVVSKFGKGNRSNRRSQEEVVLAKATSRQNSVKDASVATEMEVSYNEYSNADMSQDSGEVSREEVRPKNGKGADSFFVGLIKKGFRDLSRSSQMGENERSNVIVNGHPIPERLIKKAEKQAGPIQPGQYWYDYQAGFWGVMGHPCCGIIPPFIEEFKYPIPKNCACGNTGVFVNGRELHQKDLDLLANRGLPTFRDKSYIIEISGRVVDEDSGEELDSLGKLAPTIAKVKHGFGMRGPRVAA